MDVAARDVNAQLVSLQLLGHGSGPLLVDAGDGGVFIAAGLVGKTDAVQFLCALVQRGSETVL